MDIVPTVCTRCIVLMLMLHLLAAGEASSVTLIAPLVTVVPAAFDSRDKLPGSLVLEASIQVPADAPVDLGVGCFTTDNSGIWYQRLHPDVLKPGVHRLRFALDGLAPMAGEAHRGGWSSYQTTIVDRVGIFFWSSRQSRAKLRVNLSVYRNAIDAATDYRLADLELPGANAGAHTLSWPTGSCWSLTCRPLPFPDRPFDPERFSLTLRITDPNGAVVHIQGFYREPMQLIDRGDREVSLPGDPALFAVRWWPKVPGRHQLSLEAAWDGNVRVTTKLPDLVATGSAWDDYIRVDENDHRYFSSGGRGAANKWFWPISVGIAMVTDQRAVENGNSKRTPDRGFQSYDAYARRFSTAGVSLIQIWMGSWNFALEWNPSWPGQRGLGHYSQMNAERLDRLLDLAAQLGMRVNIVLYNHGQASTRHSAEWQHHPYNAANGGPLRSAAEVFTSDTMWHAQDRLQRYILARWGDHPAVFAWQLWTEPFGCDASGQQILVWHQRTAKRWRELDPGGRILSTYAGGFVGSSTNAWPGKKIRDIPQFDHIVDSAYRSRNAPHKQAVTDDLVNYMSTSLGRPFIISETGGTNQGGSSYIALDHRISGWSALVTGYAASPMLWWHEWVDQSDNWEPYTAVQRFITGEDLRGPAVKFQVLNIESTVDGLWSSAAIRPGRMLGYIQDQHWARAGGVPRLRQGARLIVGDPVQAGRLTCAWWDADHGTVVRTDEIDHPGGRLALPMPDFSAHLAFKLCREDTPAPVVPPK